MTLAPTLFTLTLAALLEVGGDYLIRTGLPDVRWLRMTAGALCLALYGFAVNLWWTEGFSKLLGLYVVLFFVVSQAWGATFEHEKIDLLRGIGGVLIVAGGVAVYCSRSS